MVRRSLSHSILVPVVRSFRRRATPLLISSCSRSPSSPSRSHTSYSTLSASNTVLNHAQESRMKDLLSALSNDSTSSYVWSAYTTFLGLAGSEYLPLEIHQAVLRRCSPPGEAHRNDIVLRLSRGKRTVGHEHQARFQAVIQNIRSMGTLPTLEDYNFVLGHFASTGHYEGCWEVYKEVIRVGYIPSPTTYGFCFQSIAHRFALPNPKATRETLVAVTQNIHSQYMADMRKYKVPMNPVTFDLSVRILKETLDREGFESLMRWGYGIDLSNPDRVALEHADSASVREDSNPLAPFPFTTTALNTTIDMLGRLGDVSKMIQAFEVLTQPLPQASQHFFNSFEDDDFGVAVDVSSSSRLIPAHASPNTTTYILLLRYICWADHATFARHYIIQAKRLDRSTAWRLRNDVMSLRARKAPLHTLPAPHFAISARTLLSVLGEGNKDKNLGLLKWLFTKTPYMIRKQKNDLQFYSSLLRQIQSEHHNPPPPNPNKLPSPSIFDLDVENPPPAEEPSIKPFNMDLHVQILQRNVAELEEFSRRLEFVIGRTHQRLKERLGRRVWDGKDVFFSDNMSRMSISKEKWKEVANFQSRSDSYQIQDRSKPWRPSRPQTRERRFSSTAHMASVGLQPSIPPVSVCPQPRLFHGPP